MGCFTGSAGGDAVPLITLWEHDARAEDDFAPTLKSFGRLTRAAAPTLRNATAALLSGPLPPAPLLYNKARTPLQSDLHRGSESCGSTPHETPLLFSQVPPTPVYPAAQAELAFDHGDELAIGFEKMYDSKRDQFFYINRQAQVLTWVRPTRSAMQNLDSNLRQAPTLIKHVGASVADYSDYEVVEYPPGGPHSGSSNLKPTSHANKLVRIDPIVTTITGRTTPDSTAGLYMNGRLSSLDSDMGSFASHHDFNMELESAELSNNDSRPEIDTDTWSLEKEIEDELREVLSCG